MVSIIALNMSSIRIADCCRRRPFVLERLAVIEERGRTDGSPYFHPLCSSQTTRDLPEILYESVTCKPSCRVVLNPYWCVP